MKRVIFSVMLLLLVSLQVNIYAGTKSEVKIQQSNYKEAVSIAIKFINIYTKTNKFSYALATPNFSKLYKKWKASDFIDYDRIINAQDYGEKYQLSKILKAEGNSVYILLYSTDMIGIKIPVKVTKVNGKWLVDGSGDLNIPKSFQQK